MPKPFPRGASTRISPIDSSRSLRGLGSCSWKVKLLESLGLLYLERRKLVR